MSLLQEGEQFSPDAIILEVESSANPSSPHMEQRQINYQLTLNNQVFVIKDVWASISEKDGEVYFEEEVGEAIMEKIFEIQHPEKASLRRLLKD